MDLFAAIRELYAEKERLDGVIAALESLARPAVEAGISAGGEQPRTVRHRGRTSMGDKERHQVSERMRAYWASKRGELAEKARI
ncbi:MAG: hypothetical protein LAQ30_12435 [Acidobacteriia bacterium]|nr:hypothetical protein [Terriglobia bacterium]